MAEAVKDYWLYNYNTASLKVVWDAFKAYVRGQYQIAIGLACRQSAEALHRVEARTGETLCCVG